MKMPSLLALNADHRAIRGFFVGGPVQRHPDRKTRGCVVPNDLNAADRLAAGPLSNGLQAIFSESPVAHPGCFKSRHLKHFGSKKGPPQPGVCGGSKVFRTKNR